MEKRDLGITFAGGGNRAFYQMGLLNRLADRLLPRTAAVAGCSAGACVITIFLTGRQDETAAFWIERRGHVTRNIDLANVFKGRAVAPHGPIYRDTLLYALADGGFERVRSTAFPLRFLATSFPRLLPPPVAVATGIGAYQLEKAVRRHMVHPTFGKALGFKPFAFDARDCATMAELADLIIASSSTPPFTPIGTFRANRLLDGGLVDNVPAFLAEEIPTVRRNIVLLTRPYPETAIGIRGNRLYLAPSRPIPVSRWDYTRPDLLDETISLGREDGARYERIIDEFLSAGVSSE